MARRRFKFRFLQCRNMNENETSSDKRLQQSFEFKDSQIKLLTDQNTLLLHAISSLEEKNNKLFEESKYARLKLESLNKEVNSLTSTNQLRLSKIQYFERELKEETVKRNLVTKQNETLLSLSKDEKSKHLAVYEKLTAIKSEVNKKEKLLSELTTSLEKSVSEANMFKKENRSFLQEMSGFRQKLKNLETENIRIKHDFEVEVESLQDQVRLRKQHHYNMLQKLDKTELRSKHFEKENIGLQEKIQLVSHSLLDTKNKLLSYEEATEKKAFEKNIYKDKEKNMQEELFSANKKRLKFEKIVKKLEDENFSLKHQVSNLGDKVFELLQRLKIADTMKTKNMELLKQRETDSLALVKRTDRLNAKLLKNTKETASLKGKLDEAKSKIYVLTQSLSKIAQKMKSEVSHSLAQKERWKKIEEENGSLVNRIEFLITKLRSQDEVHRLDCEKLRDLSNKIKLIEKALIGEQQKIRKAKDINESLVDSLQLKNYENEKLQTELRLIKSKILKGKSLDKKEERNIIVSDCSEIEKESITSHKFRLVENFQNVKGLFMLTPLSKSSLGQEILKYFKFTKFLIELHGNTSTKKHIVLKLKGLLETIYQYKVDAKKLNEKTAKLASSLEKSIATESQLLNKSLKIEDSKRKLLLRYITDKLEKFSVKYNEATSGKIINLNLRNFDIEEEECHVITAALKSFNPLIKQGKMYKRINLKIDLSDNLIDDDGLKAFFPLINNIKQASDIKFDLLDLNGNLITAQGVEYIAEILRQKNDVIRHVHIHAAGKIEALGAKVVNAREIKVDTVFVIDCGRKGLIDKKASISSINTSTITTSCKQKHKISLGRKTVKIKTPRLLQLNHDTTRLITKERNRLI